MSEQPDRWELVGGDSKAIRHMRGHYQIVLECLSKEAEGWVSCRLQEIVDALNGKKTCGYCRGRAGNPVDQCPACSGFGYYTDDIDPAVRLLEADLVIARNQRRHVGELLREARLELAFAKTRIEQLESEITT